MRSSHRLAWLVAASCIAFSGAAAAQTEEKGYGYRFDDDQLVGDTLGTTPALLKIRPGASHVTLLRPRVHFVAELLKSVETL
jgi:hypothetical protein